MRKTAGRVLLRTDNSCSCNVPGITHALLAHRDPAAMCSRHVVQCAPPHFDRSMQPTPSLLLSIVGAPPSTVQLWWCDLSGASKKLLNDVSVYCCSFKGSLAYRRARLDWKLQLSASWMRQPPRDRAWCQYGGENICWRVLALFSYCAALICGYFCNAGSSRLYLSARSARTFPAAVAAAQFAPQPRRQGILVNIYVVQ